MRKPSLTDDDAPPLQDATAASAEQARCQALTPSRPHALMHSTMHAACTLHCLEAARTCKRPGARRGWHLLRA